MSTRGHHVTDDEEETIQLAPYILTHDHRTYDARRLLAEQSIRVPKRNSRAAEPTGAYVGCTEQETDQDGRGSEAEINP